jgi:hypothetical protein
MMPWGTRINACHRRKKSKVNQAAYNLMFDASHHNDMSGREAFAKRAKSRRSKEIAEHVAGLQTLMALYDRTSDGEAETVCEAIEREEDWLKDQLERDLLVGVIAVGLGR